MVSTDTSASSAMVAIVVAVYPVVRNCRWATSRIASRLRLAAAGVVTTFDLDLPYI
jgi:hypothetical protein